MFQAKDKRTHKVHQRTVCFQYVVEIDFWFVSFYFIVYFIVVHSPWVYHQIFFSFSFLFLFLLPLERPPIGFGGGRRLCGIIMESSWENCPWKGLSEKERKKERKIWSCFRSFSETFIRALLLFGGQPHFSPNPLTSSAGWDAWFRKMLFLFLFSFFCCAQICF